jgi:hypothetical protein
LVWYNRRRRQGMDKYMTVKVVQGSLTAGELVGVSIRKRVTSSSLNFRTGVCTVNYSDGTVIQIVDGPPIGSRPTVIRRKVS